MNGTQTRQPQQHPAEALVPNVPGRQDRLFMEEIVSDVQKLKR